MERYTCLKPTVAYFDRYYRVVSLSHWLPRRVIPGLGRHVTGKTSRIVPISGGK